MFYAIMETTFFLLVLRLWIFYIIWFCLVCTIWKKKCQVQPIWMLRDDYKCLGCGFMRVVVYHHENHHKFR
jgi:hypothetical protein